MSHVLDDKNRRDVTLTTSKTGEVLPAFYEQENPKLISLLDTYYDFLDSDGRQAFSDQIKEIHHARDIAQTNVTFLDELIKEIGNGLQSSSFFQKPRLMATLLASFYRSKGTLVSTEGFFRGFFNEEVTVEYPKNNMFIVGESEIGFDSQKFIQDNGVFQIFSILLKVGLSTVDYEALYKKFVHPAGFHFAGEVASTNELNLSLTASGQNPLDSAVALSVLSSQVAFEPIVFSHETTALIDSGGVDDAFRVNVNQLVSRYANDPNVTAGSLGGYYSSVVELLTPNSFTFDDSATVSPDISMTFETMDNDIFTRYSASILDSTI